MLKFFKSEEDPIPLPPRCVTLARPTERDGFVRLKLRPEPKNENDAVYRICTWIKSANFCIDIGFVFIFHKNIIQTLIDQCKIGVRVRVLICRDHIYVHENKSEKHVSYVEYLKQAGIQVRFADFWSKAIEYRILLLDASDPEDRPEACGNAPCAMFWDAPHIEDLLHRSLLKHDLLNVRVRNKSADTVMWRQIFEKMWNADVCTTAL